MFTAKELIKEKMEPVAPRGKVFDWDAYSRDVKNGISLTESNRKIANGEYMVTKK
jgi:antirestriction protein